MTISEKIFLYLILFSIGAEYVRSTRKYRRQFDSFSGMNAPQSNFNPSDMGQGQVQVQPLSNLSPSAHMQPMWNQWAQKPPKTQTPPPTTTTEQYRYLPHSPRKSHTTTTTPTTTYATHHARRKFSAPDIVTEKSRDLIADRDRTIAHISAKLQPYFMRALVQDFGMRMLNKTREANVLLAANEMTALENQCATCTVAELQSLLNIQLTLMEKYPAYNSDNSLAGHVATEYERATDFLNRKLDQLRKEIAEARYDADFRNIQRRYNRRERNGGIMTLLLEWFESFGHNGQDNEQDIYQKLIKHLTTQKRYWLISIKGVL